MTLSQALRASRQVILRDGWTAGSRLNGRHCAVDAVYTATLARLPAGTSRAKARSDAISAAQVEALYAALCGRTSVTKKFQKQECVVANFNNSTSRYAVLALFDAAIAAAGREERTLRNQTIIDNLALQKYPARRSNSESG